MTDLWFVCGFLPALMLVSRTRYRDLLVLVLSWLFYAWLDVRALAILALVTIWTWACLHETKRNLWVDCGGIVLLLAVFRMLGQVPLGLYFYGLSAMALIAGTTGPLSFVKTGLALGLFTCAQTGPVLEHSPERTRNTQAGACLFLLGWAQKLLLADNLQTLLVPLASQTTYFGLWSLAIVQGLAVCTLICAWGLMATGAGALAGYAVPLQFGAPFRAKSPLDFVKNLSLPVSAWFERFVKAPLSGRLPAFLAVFAAVALAGLWAGPAWMLPALYWGILCAALPACPAWLVWLLSLPAWMLSTAPAKLVKLAGIGISGFGNGTLLFGLWTHALVLALACVCLSRLPARIYGHICRMKQGTWILAAFYACLFLLCLGACLFKELA